MKKIFYAAIISLVTVLCVSATIAHNADGTYSSSVTANIAGLNDDINLKTDTLVELYNMMPQSVKSLCIASYKDIAPQIEKNIGKSFSYSGIKISPIKTETGIDLKFHTGHYSLVVNNYTQSEFDTIFGL
jgi:hypothetical protein